MGERGGKREGQEGGSGREKGAQSARRFLKIKAGKGSRPAWPSEGVDEVSGAWRQKVAGMEGRGGAAGQTLEAEQTDLGGEGGVQGPWAEGSEC